MSCPEPVFKSLTWINSSKDLIHTKLILILILNNIFNPNSWNYGLSWETDWLLSFRVTHFCKFLGKTYFTDILLLYKVATFSGWCIHIQKWICAALEGKAPQGSQVPQVEGAGVWPGWGAWGGGSGSGGARRVSPHEEAKWRRLLSESNHEVRIGAH